MGGIMKDGKAYFFGSGESYSTEEQVIGTWIDGKPIYRKVITKDIEASECESGTLAIGTVTIGGTNCTTTLGSYLIKIPSNITNISRVIDIRGCSDGYYGANAVSYGSFYSSGAFLHGWYNYQTNTLNVRMGTDYATKGLKFIAIIEYTKTTD